MKRRERRGGGEEEKKRRGGEEEGRVEEGGEEKEGRKADNDQQLSIYSAVFSHAYRSLLLLLLLLLSALLSTNWKHLKVLLELRRNHTHLTPHVRRHRYLQCPAPKYPALNMLHSSPCTPPVPPSSIPCTWTYQFHVIPLHFISLPISPCPT